MESQRMPRPYRPSWAHWSSDFQKAKVLVTLPMQITGQLSCARFRARETETHVGGDSGPRLAFFLSLAGCREVVSF